MGEPFLVALPQGDDLLDAVTRTFRERSVRKAAFSTIGLLTHAVLGCYNPASRQYATREFEGPLEIVSCTGNVSEKDGDVFVHSHIVLADEDFRCIGGHLMPGCVIFVGELHGAPVPGPIPVRTFDEARGLYLWSGSRPENEY